MTEEKRGWSLLHSQLPPKSLKALDKSVYNVSGLTDVNEGYLIQRLFASELLWDWRIESQQYLGHEDRKSQSGNDYRVYFASVHGVLWIDGRQFHGSGASDNRKLDAAFKGAATVAFKNACKVAGLTAELYLDGRAIDHIYDSAQKNRETRDSDNQEAGAAALPTPAPRPPASAPPDAQRSGGVDGGVTRSTPPSALDIAARARQFAKANGYAPEDAVCPSCGKREALGGRSGAMFCAKGKGGCGWPSGKGERGTPISYGEYLERQRQERLVL